MLTSGFTVFSNKEPLYNFNTIPSQPLLHTVAAETEDEDTFYGIPYSGKSFNGFKQAIANKESAGNYQIINSFGFLGKYQFGRAALSTIGVRNVKQFLQSPTLQENAFMALLSRNKASLKEYIQKYEGKTVRGIVISESGILAAAHLAGVKSVKIFLNTNGNKNFSDGYGTSLVSYLKRFSGYDTSEVNADAAALAY